MFGKKDVLEQQDKRVQMLQEESVRAVDVVEAMFGSLQRVNDSIAKQREEIDTYVGRLSQAKGNLDETFRRNEKIMGNIKKLLEADV